MIIADFSQVAHVIFHSGFNDVGYSLDPFKHKFINYLLFTKSRFKKYGEMVIALDSRNYWRKDVFPEYKANRSVGREESDIDWTKVYANFESLQKDLREHIPWKLIGAHKAEADDVIGVLCARFHQQEEILIVSADKDFLQLQKYKGVAQYSPKMKKLLVESNPEASLREKIIRGDGGDGIPTIHCRDDWFTNPDTSRAPSITQKWLQPVLRSPNIEDMLTEDEKKGYKRNQQLIDLSFIPKDISQNIIDVYNSYVTPKKSGVFSYLNDKGYNNLIDMIEHF